MLKDPMLPFPPCIDVLARFLPCQRTYYGHPVDRAVKGCTLLPERPTVPCGPGWRYVEVTDLHNNLPSLSDRILQSYCPCATSFVCTQMPSSCRYTAPLAQQGWKTAIITIRKN